MKKLFTLVFLCLFALNASAQELGEFNTNFGTDGTFLFEPSEAHDFMEKILVQEDGKIITVGRARLDKKNYSIYVSRHNADGTLDDTYGEGGYVFLKVDPLIYLNRAYDADLGEDGYLYIAGHTYDYTNNTAFVICLDENGFENEDYGDKGYVVSEYGGGIVYTSIDVDSKGRAVVAGYINDQILVTRYNAKGKLDQTFGDKGTVIVNLGENYYGNAFDVKVEESGKIVVVGDIFEAVEGGSLYYSCIMRLKSNGDLDNTFADNGVLFIYAGEYAEYCMTLSIQADGKYLVGGHDELWSETPELPRYESFIVRVNTDGTIDETFGTNGFVKFEPFEGDGCTNSCDIILAAPDGQIFGAIYSYNFVTSASRSYVYNLDANGQLKEDFAGSGIAALPKYADDESESQAAALALKDNKNLLVGGQIAVEDSYNMQLFISEINVDVKGDDEGNEDDTTSVVGNYENRFNIHPNPATTTISIEGGLNDNAQVSIIDLTGRCVKEVEISGAVSTINIEDVESGIYFISVKQNDNNFVEKLVVK